MNEKQNDKKMTRKDMLLRVLLQTRRGNRLSSTSAYIVCLRLAEGDAVSIGIAESLKLDDKYVRMGLCEAQAQGLAERCGKWRNMNVWRLTQDGKQFISNFTKSVFQ